MKWADVKKGDLNAALSAVKNDRDPEAANNLIGYFHERMKAGEPYDVDALHELMAHVFSEMVEKKRTADQALGLALVRGKYRRTDNFERNISGAAYIVLLTRNGWRYQDAVGEAANLLFDKDKGDKAMQAAYTEYREALNWLPSEKLSEMLPLGTPVIKRDKAG
ncbi:MAG: hypothetical protein JNK97_12315 [Zoogloea sp.]|nr:hypothetical protein [Zoogloea sp.]